MPTISKEDVAAIIADEDLEQLTAKTVRVKLEEKLGLEPGALKAQKEEISAVIDAVINEKEGNEQEDQEEEEEEEEEEKPKAKKAKTAATSENPNKGKMTCTTKSGEEAPKNVKKMQETMKGMSAKKFLESGKAIEFEVDGNVLRGEPRSFSSGAMGWYLGGKVEVEVGGQTVRAAPPRCDAGSPWPVIGGCALLRRRPRHGALPSDAADAGPMLTGCHFARASRNRRCGRRSGATLSSLGATRGSADVCVREAEGCREDCARSARTPRSKRCERGMFSLSMDTVLHTPLRARALEGDPVSVPCAYLEWLRAETEKCQLLSLHASSRYQPNESVRDRREVGINGGRA